MVLVIQESSSSASMVSALPEVCSGISSLIHLISFKLVQNNLLDCNFAVALRKFRAVVLSEGQFSSLLCGGISALIFFDRLSLEPTDGMVFYCVKLPVLSYLVGILDLSNSQ